MAKKNIFCYNKVSDKLAGEIPAMFFQKGLGSPKKAHSVLNKYDFSCCSRYPMG
ncbi:hypothetical protein LEQ41_09865 [Streptococcus agalactiae]|nr:hypothetical protein [Streptococcus agalactiae]